MRPRVHWSDLLIGVAAIWLILSPVALGYDIDHLPDLRAPAINAYATGIGLLVFCLISAWRLEDIGNEIVNIGFGCWLVLSPYALGFSDLTSAALNAVMVGITVVAAAVWDLRS
jgi:hypothetical protein